MDSKIIFVRTSKGEDEHAARILIWSGTSDAPC